MLLGCLFVKLMHLGCKSIDLAAGLAAAFLYRNTFEYSRLQGLGLGQHSPTEMLVYGPNGFEHAVLRALGSLSYFN